MNRRCESVRPRARATSSTRWIDASNARIGVAQDGEKRIGGERDDGDARGAFSQPWQRQKESEHGQRGNGLQDFGGADTGLAQRGERVSQMPAGMAMAAANSMAAPVSQRCSMRERRDLAAVSR